MLYHIAIGKNDYCKIIINRAFQVDSGGNESACTARDVGNVFRESREIFGKGEQDHR